MPAAPAYILAIDEGTTGVTVLLFDHAATIVATAQSEFSQHFPQPGWVEHDANEIWTVTQGLIAQVLATARAVPADLAGIGITNQRETTVLWDRATGEPVAPAIVWQDRRSAAFCDELRRQGLQAEFRARTGLVIDPYFSATKLHWLLEHTPGLRQQAEAGRIAFGTIDSWLIHRLTGGQVHTTDVSNASRTMLFNINRCAWDQDILDWLKIPEAMLPKVMPSSCIFGHTAKGGLFNAEIPVAGVVGDQQAALFGQACHAPGLAKNTYGTGSFVLLNTGQRAAIIGERLLTTIAWQLGGKPAEYALEGSIFATGAAVQWLRDGLQIIRSAGETQALAESIAGNDGVYFVPALSGLGSPHWDPYARGALLGLTRGSTRAHIVRATLESIAYQTRDVMDAMQQDSGVQLTTLRADGGASVNAFLMQFQADILGVPVEVPKITETTSLGAAYMAGLATGFWSGEAELAAHWKCAAHYEPKMTADQRESLYTQWTRALDRSRNWAQQ